MLSFNPLGLEASGIRVAFDSSGEHVFVSHAHFDHAPSLKRCKKLFCTSATADLLKARGKTVSANCSESFSGGSLTVSLRPSGHVLGSAMLYAESGSASVLYSSDFKTRDSLTMKAAAPANAETLVVEATYGVPQYSFPSREETYAEIASWTKKSREKGIVLLGGYSLGKAQELIKCLNELAGIAPLVPAEIAGVNEVYKKHGVALDFVPIESDEGKAELKKNFVAVLSPKEIGNGLSKRLSEHYGKRIFTAFASGWCLFGSNGFDKGFPLSDHADYEELIGFVEACAPRKVFCTHGFSRELAADLRKRGFDASAVEETREASKLKITSWF